MFSNDVPLYVLRCSNHLPTTRAKRIVNGSNNTTHFNTMCPVVPEIWKIGVHVDTCRCAPLVACIKGIDSLSASLTIDLLSAQCAQLFPRYRKVVRTYRCATPCKCMAHLRLETQTHGRWVSKCTANFSAIRPVVPEIDKIGMHTRYTCVCTPLLGCVKHIAMGL